MNPVVEYVAFEIKNTTFPPMEGLRPVLLAHRLRMKVQNFLPPSQRTTERMVVSIQRFAEIAIFGS